MTRIVRPIACRLRIQVLLPVACALAILQDVSGGAGQRGGPGEPPSTRRMAERLQRIVAETDPRTNQFMNGARARLLEEAVQHADPASVPQVLGMLADELLNAGRTQEAISRYEQVERMMREAGVEERSREWFELLLRQAIAHLRRGEEQNCVGHHGARSCIFPIRGTGVHAEKGGSRASAAILERALKLDPSHLQARWLLNIAHMTMGDYPTGVRPRWLLDPRLADSEFDIKPFPDVARGAGLEVVDLAGGSIVDDLDGDGDLDVMASAMGLQSQLRYFRNEAGGSFMERTAEAGLTGLVGGLNIMQTDFNNDGRLDVLVLRGGWMGTAGKYPKSLLRNDGDGSFTDVTEQAGLLSFHPSQTAVWLDFDADGWLDLFVGNESTRASPEPCELYRNNRDGTFTECARETGVAVTEFVKGVASGDYDNDGRPDIYVSVRGGPNHLYRNEGPAAPPAGGDGRRPGPCAWRFIDVAAAAGVTEPIHSFPTWFWDYDNDGWEDIFVSGYMANGGDVAADYIGRPHGGELPRLYRNRGDGTFADVTREARLARLLLTMGSNYGDLDNDGWLDFYAGTGNPELSMLIPNRAFRNAEGRFFQDVTTSGGLGHLQKGHGVSFPDIDNDGDQDIHHVLGGALEGDRFANALFENPGHGNHWIVLGLEGVRSNRPGIGARLKVVVQTPSGERAIHKTVRSGGSFGASPLRQEIGLGSAERILRVEILWPSGGPPQILQGLELDRRYLLTEGSGVRALNLKPFKLGRVTP